MRCADIAVIGAGAAGMMAAVQAGSIRKEVILVERNSSPGRKILLSGKGRCNITNVAPIEEFLVRFGRQGGFLRSAFQEFFHQELTDFFQAKGLELKIERQARVFPATDRAESVLDVLRSYLKENKVEILYNTRLKEVKKTGDNFILSFYDRSQLPARRAILATGGKSFSFTGSSGDGFALARKLGHSIVPLRPGLVPLRLKEPWVKKLSGLRLRNVRISFRAAKKKIESPVGEAHFTPFGISGALVLDLSASALRLLEQAKPLFLYIDLKPGLSYEQLDARLVRDFAAMGNKGVREVLGRLLPEKLIDVFIALSGIDCRQEANQVSKDERQKIISLAKSLPFEVSGSLGIEEAMVTCGGVSTAEINPKTMESRIVPGLYFAGEIIDASASSGGYNLQQAFSTGYLAGRSAAESLGVQG